jgi:3-(3-hydroxy-phenyl)propionate hydroxylase
MIGHGGTPWEMDWCSVYSARALTLPDYVHGRVLLLRRRGPPAADLRRARRQHRLAGRAEPGLALAAVVQGRRARRCCSSYSAERVAAAREIIDEAGKSTRFMTPPTRGFRLLRDAVLSLALSQDFVRPLYHWRTSRPHEYTHSPLNSPNDDNRLFTCQWKVPT